MLESELFGFERGAFTGAIQHRPGKFEFANQGTLFLDEVGAMTPSLQAKLLHVLEDGEFSRLGGKVDVHVDVRVIAATNQHLDAAVAAGRFREDLFARLNEVTIDLPPLRERREEIPALTDFFIKKYPVQYNRPLIEITPPTLQALVNHDWPGNVRELENLAKRVVVLGSEVDRAEGPAARRRSVPARRPAQQRRRCTRWPSSGGYIGRRGGEQPAVAVAAAAGEMPVRCRSPPIEPGQYSLKDISRHAAREAERELILRMLQHTRWNRKEAAEILGISYKALLYKIKENGLDRARRRP